MRLITFLLFLAMLPLPMPNSVSAASLAPVEGRIETTSISPQAADLTCVDTRVYGDGIGQDKQSAEWVFTGGLPVFGTNSPASYKYNTEVRSVVIIDLSDTFVPQDATVLLTLADFACRCDGDATPSIVQVSWFVSDSPTVSLDDWGRGGSSITQLTTASDGLGPNAYSVDITSAVKEFLIQANPNNRYLGLHFAPTQATDFEDFAAARLLISAPNCEQRPNLAVTALEVVLVSCNSASDLYVDIDVNITIENPSDESIEFIATLYVADKYADSKVIESETLYSFLPDWSPSFFIPDHVTDIAQLQGEAPIPIRVEVVPTGEFNDETPSDNTMEIQYTFELPSVCRCKPEIGQVLQEGAPAVIDKPFKVDVEVKLPDSCPVPRRVTVYGMETGFSDPEKGFRLDALHHWDGDDEQKQVIQPGAKATFTFEDDGHHWDWTGLEGESCPEAFAADLAYAGIGGILKAADWIIGARDLMDTWNDVATTVPGRKYSLKFVAAASPDEFHIKTLDIAVDSPSALIVGVPEIQTTAFTAMKTAELAGSVATAVGTAATVAPPAAFTAMGTEIVSYEMACVLLYQARGEPAPKRSPTPSFDQIPVSEGEDFIKTMQEAQELLANATNELAASNESPTVGSVAASSNPHLEKALEHLTAYQSALDEVTALIPAYVDSLDDVVPQLDEATIDQVQAELAANGLPAIEQTILLELGWTQEAIDAMAAQTSAHLDYAPTNWWQAQYSSISLLKEQAEIVVEGINELLGIPSSSLFLPVVSN